MPQAPSRKDLSLRALEIFQICAQKGSLQDVANETGLSVSTISHHLRNLEQTLGVALFNHNRRPMTLTPKGHTFLRSIDTALSTIRKAKAEASAGSFSEASFLRVGSIEDFDSDIVPELAVMLSDAMPHCDFLYHTDNSHALIDMLREHKLDIGITSASSERIGDLQDRPLLRDPFVVVLPAGFAQPIEDIVSGQSDLPFIRFSSGLIIARLIEAQLRRMGTSPPHRFECSNDRTMMAMVAAGAGWAITTPLLFSRARRFQDRVAMRPFPGKSFARSLSILATPDCSRSVMELIDGNVRHLIKHHILEPACANEPWLSDGFRLLD